MRDPIQPAFRERIQADWIDYNGHLNEAFYLLIFSHATDELIDRIGMDAGYREREKRSIYTLETHILYALEVKQGVEVEVRTIEEAKAALSAGVDIIMLDNMPVHMVHEAVKTIKGRTKVDVSGNITLDNLLSYAPTGVDYVSVGEITHSAPAMDIHMTVKCT
ncbi:MAG TPA: thioesterase family protein [bacterium]|nr:thioesterase family protein [bacterium]